MKTGRDATQPGLYISECCLSEVTFEKGQMFSRCPACSALTIWEFVKPEPPGHKLECARRTNPSPTSA